MALLHILVGLSLRARLKYLGRSIPSALPSVSNTPFSDQKNLIPSTQSDEEIIKHERVPCLHM